MQGSLQNIPLARKPSFVAEALFLMLPVCWQKHTGKEGIDPGFLQKPAEQIILWPAVLPHRARDRPVRILDSPVLCWTLSPPAVFYCLTLFCSLQIGSCCPVGPGRWGKCFLVSGPYCGEPNASRLLQWHPDNITGELAPPSTACTALMWWFLVKG